MSRGSTRYQLAVELQLATGGGVDTGGGGMGKQQAASSKQAAGTVGRRTAGGCVRGRGALARRRARYRPSRVPFSGRLANLFRFATTGNYRLILHDVHSLQFVCRPVSSMARRGSVVLGHAVPHLSPELRARPQVKPCRDLTPDPPEIHPIHGCFPPLAAFPDTETCNPFQLVVNNR